MATRTWFGAGVRGVGSVGVMCAVLGGAPSGMAAQTPFAGPPTPRLSFYEPGISPDGRTIAFVHGGDIWTVDATGGEARLLIAHEEEESRPLFSPDGEHLAFESYRDGTSHLYVYDFATGETRQVTFLSASAELSAWSPDGEWLWFSSNSHDISGMADVFRVRASGGTPMPVIADRYAGDFRATESSDGRLAFAARGRMAYSQWWRNGHSHMDESEIWVADTSGQTPQFTRTSAGGKNQWPIWLDADRIAFVSDRDGSENLWSVEPGGEPRRHTDFEDGRLLWPSYAPGSGVVAFERDFRIWTHDVASGRTTPLEIRPVGAVQSARTEPSTRSSFSGFAISPDGEKVVVSTRGELFAGAAGEGESGNLTTRITHTPAPEGEVVWASDSHRIAYTSTRNGRRHLFHYDFRTGDERQLTDSDLSDQAPAWDPEGERIAFVRNGAELRVLEVGSGDEQVVASGLIGFGSARVFTPPVWSPDGRWLAYLATPDGEFWNVHVVPADGSADARPVSFLANTFGGSIAWAPDGRSIFYATSQRTEDTRVVRIDLVPRTPSFRETALRELFEMDPPEGGQSEEDDEDAEPGAEDEVPEVRIDFDGIRRRYSLLPISLSVGDLAVSPDGKTLVVSGSAAGRPNLFAYNLDPLSDESGLKQITNDSGFKGSLQFAKADRVWFLQGGRVRSISVDGNGARSVSLQAEMEIDFHTEKNEVFLENWSALNEGFYDENHHGADWPAVGAVHRDIVAGARNRQEMRRALLLMTGELNASHLGVSGSEAPSTPQVGRLGLRFDRAQVEASGRFVVAERIDLGPAHVSGQIEVGDRLVSVNGIELDRATNLNRLLRGTIGERVEVGVERGGEEHTAIVRPISVGAEKGLLYEQWVDSRRAYVAEVSGGRLGYVHIPDMGSGSLQGLYLDLDQENRSREGAVVDVRNNNGGFVNAYALDVFTRRSFMTMQPRGGAEASSRHQLGQRAYLDPVILVTNQNTLSDGEDFTEGWRQLGIGEVVGEPTASWIIYTSNTALFDGTFIRLPFIGIRGAAGDNMELSPRPVDVEVERPAGEWYSGRDAQLDVAVERLLARIDGGG